MKDPLSQLGAALLRLPSEHLDEVAPLYQESVKFASMLMDKLLQYNKALTYAHEILEKNNAMWAKAAEDTKDMSANVGVMKETLLFELHCAKQDLERYKEKYGPLDG